MASYSQFYPQRMRQTLRSDLAKIPDKSVDLYRERNRLEKEGYQGIGKILTLASGIPIDKAIQQTSGFKEDLRQAKRGERKEDWKELRGQAREWNEEDRIAQEKRAEIRTQDKAYSESIAAQTGINHKRLQLLQMDRTKTTQNWLQAQKRKIQAMKDNDQEAAKQASLDMQMATNRMKQISLSLNQLRGTIDAQEEAKTANRKSVADRALSSTDGLLDKELALARQWKDKSAPENPLDAALDILPPDTTQSGDLLRDVIWSLTNETDEAKKARLIRETEAVLGPMVDSQKGE